MYNSNHMSNNQRNGDFYEMSQNGLDYMDTKIIAITYIVQKVLLYLNTCVDVLQKLIKSGMIKNLYCSFCLLSMSNIKERRWLI